MQNVITLCVFTQSAQFYNVGGYIELFSLCSKWNTFKDPMKWNFVFLNIGELVKIKYKEMVCAILAFIH